MKESKRVEWIVLRKEAANWRCQTWVSLITKVRATESRPMGWTVRATAVEDVLGGDEAGQRMGSSLLAYGRPEHGRGDNGVPAHSNQKHKYDGFLRISSCGITKGDLWV